MIDKKGLEREFSLILKYRAPVMAFSILWVAFFHTGLYFETDTINFIRIVGYGGVDIFFFLSGIGAYYSLSKNHDHLEYYKRRMKRLFPTYLPFILIWFSYFYIKDILALEKFMDALNYLRDFLGNIVMIGWIQGLPHQFNWYVQTVVLFYIFTPIIYVLVRKKSTGINILLLFIATGCIIATINTPQLMAASRILIFLLGLWSVPYVERCMSQNICRQKVVVFCLYAGMIIGCILLWIFVKYFTAYLWPLGLWWHPFILIVPGFCLLLSHVFECCSKIRLGTMFIKLLNIIGACTFEIYLVQIALYQIVPRFIHIEGRKRWIFLLIASVVLGILYKKLVDKLVAILYKKSKKVVS